MKFCILTSRSTGLRPAAFAGYRGVMSQTEATLVAAILPCVGPRNDGTLQKDLTVSRSAEGIYLFKRNMGDFLTDGKIDLKVIHLYDGKGNMGDSPMYGFFIFLAGTTTRVGEISFRFVTTHTVAHFAGHIGYGIDSKYRGKHLAEKASRILVDLAKEHGLNRIFFTCAPDNVASIRTCQRLGACDCGLVELPERYRDENEIPEPHYRRYLLSLR